jgi:hypothetical protein
MDHTRYAVSPRGRLGGRLLFWSCAVMLACSGDTGSSAPGQGAAGSGGQVVATGGSPGSGGNAVGGEDSSGGGGAADTGGAAGSTAGTGGGGAGGSATDDAGQIETGAIDAGDQDTPAPRPLQVTAAKARHEHTFKPSQADPDVNPATTFSDGNEVAIVDPRSKTMMGKLVVTMGGRGSMAGAVGGEGSFCVPRGFHVFAVTYYTDYDIIRGDADFYGDARLEVFEGIDHTNKYEFANVHITKPDSIEVRVAKGLKYLHGLYPDEDWGYYLNADGQVRWSDVIFTGVSHGATASARNAMVRRAARAVSFSGPYDNTCDTDPACPNGTSATWFGETPKTPIDRFYAITGVKDDQHPHHLYAMQKLGYVGNVVDVDTMKPPYGNTHRLQSASAGHTDFCGDAKYKDACNYLFGVPPENQAGVP